MTNTLRNPFAERLIGHRGQWANLSSLVKSQRVPHALLFCGPSGTGKRLAAYALAAELLSAHAHNPENSAKLLESGSHPDLHPLQREEEKRDISVDAVRGLRSSLQLQPYLGTAAVALIDNAHEMTTAASNALLLTLEEPANGKFLILISHQPQRLPETIVSRCQTVFFGDLSDIEIATVARQIFHDKITEKSLPPLLLLTGHNLSALGLGTFVHERTLLFDQENAAWKHVADLLERSRGLQASFERIFSGEPNLAGDALSLASTISEEKGDDLSWLVLRGVLRKAMRDADETHGRRYADLLLQALEAERLIRDRNANPQLQLSSLFVRAGSVG